MRITKDKLIEMIKKNEDVTGVDVSGITDMSYLFCHATEFNQDISNWDTSKVTNMSWMFCDAHAFDQNIGNWDVSKVTNMSYMFTGSPLYNGGYYRFKNGIVCIDGIIATEKKRFGNAVLLVTSEGKEMWALTDGMGIWSHGRTKEAARRDLEFKKSSRDTGIYKDWDLDRVVSLDEAVLCYRTITGACYLGCEMFIEGDSSIKRESYTIREVLELTRGQYKSEKFASFFSKSH